MMRTIAVFDILAPVRSRHVSVQVVSPVMGLEVSPPMGDWIPDQASPF